MKRKTDREKMRNWFRRSWMIRWSAFMVGIWVMALGIVMMIQADLGLAPWDVLHMGLAYVTPLTVGMWLQIVGFVLVSLASLLDRKWPGPGAVLNMILVGFFVDTIMAFGWYRHLMLFGAERFCYLRDLL